MTRLLVTSCEDMPEDEETIGLLKHEEQIQKPATVGSSRFRMLAATAIFVAVAAVGALVFTGTYRSGSKKHLRHGYVEGLLSMVELTERKECTGEHQDPWSTGRHEPCCHGLKEKLGQWDGSGRHHYSCIDETPGGPSCEEQWDNMACVHAGGHWECFTCGDRITWVERQGIDKKKARRRVADEFFGECGACDDDKNELAIETEGYRLAWADEFNSNGPVDSSRWKSVHSHGNGFGNHELQFYTDRQTNAWISDGTLKIRAAREDFGGKKYTSAKLKTHAAWRYGKFSVRARLQHGDARGTWPAIWLLPQHWKYGGWPKSGEIDVMEHVGYEPGRIHGTVHTDAYHHSIGTQKGGSMHTDVRQWHTYTVEWRPEVVIFACDDAVYQVFRKESDDSSVWPFNQEFYLILNMAVGGDWGGVRGVDEDAFSGKEGQVMEVDWVRIEQRDLNWALNTPTTPATPTQAESSSTPATPATPTQADCQPAADACNVPKDQCATIVGEKYCQQVEVRGTLTVSSQSTLHTPLLRVYEGGILHVGTEHHPAVDVELDLTNGGQLISDGEVFINGEPKTSWTTLSEECDHCKTISVKACDGWKVGDQIVVVGTGDGQNGQVQANEAYRTDERKIASISKPLGACKITLDHPARQKHRSEWYKGKVPINSEVLNMDRSVRITGTGIRTRQQHSGIMKMHYASLSNCGALHLGEYCLHFHHVGKCPDCSFKGNVVTRSVNKAITVHGTSQAVVEGNVVYDHKGAFLYVEDGNEVGNVFKHNALVCPRKAPHCSLHNGIAEHKASDLLEQAGIYAVSASNDFIGNHISGMENAFFHDFQSGSKVWGNNHAAGKVCPQANPWGKVSDNYFHNNQGFGFYAPHSSYPTRVKTDSIGQVTDWNSCLGFDPYTGEDNSQGYQVTNHVELFHNFGAGGYDGGETSFKNAVFAFALAGNYYKTFRRGKRSGPFCEDCHIVDTLHPITPGGSCMWEYKNTIFDNILYGLHVNHHCGNDGEWTGGLCASHVWFSGSSEWKGDFKLLNDGFENAHRYTDTIVHRSGSTYFSTAGSHPVFRTSDCTRHEYHGEHVKGHFTECRTDKIRIVRIYSANRGDITVTNKDEGYYSRTIPYTPWRKDPHWGRPNVYDVGTDYQNGGMGYTFLVKAGQSYEIRVNPTDTLPDLFTLEYSDLQMPVDSIQLEVKGDPLLTGSCIVNSKHNRDWITPYGPYLPESGAWWQCVRWPAQYTVAQHRAVQQRHLVAHRR